MGITRSHVKDKNQVSFSGAERGMPADHKIKGVGTTRLRNLATIKQMLILDPKKNNKIRKLLW